MKKTSCFLGLLALFILGSLVGVGPVLAQEGAPFRVTTRPMANPEAEEVLVGDYETFYEALAACKQEDLDNLYIVSLQEDTTIPAKEWVLECQEENILLRSGEGGPFSLTKTGDRKLAYINKNCQFTVENIILDGNGEAEAFSLDQNGILNLGQGAILQNFADVGASMGSVLSLSGQSTLNIDGATLQNNRALGGGKKPGAIYAKEGTTINIASGEFKDNTSDYLGGLILSWGDITISGGDFSGNSAASSGGVLASYGGEVSISGGTFRANTCPSGIGGALTFKSPGKGLTISGGDFSNNQAKWGGAIYMQEGSQLSIRGASFTENIASSQGGVLYLQGGDLFLKDSSLTRNQADSRGGALVLSSPSQALEIGNCQFEENTSSLGGGIYLMETAHLQLASSKFIGNQASSGGAIYASPYEYEPEITDPKAYRNIKTDGATLFEGNRASQGLFNPPSNYQDFTNLQFDPASDVRHEILTRGSLLNNYDINYENPVKLVIFDANGGQFTETGQSRITLEHPQGQEIALMEAPVKEDHLFEGWDCQKRYSVRRVQEGPGLRPQGGQGPVQLARVLVGNEATGPLVEAQETGPREVDYGPGDTYVVETHTLFVAQWKEEPGPQPEKPSKPSKPSRPLGPQEEDLNREDHYQYMEGYPGGVFRPQEGMTRAELAVMFTRLLKDRPEEDQAYPTPFKDVAPGAWYRRALGYAVKKGLIWGYPDGTFKPDQAISREEFAAMAARFAQLSEKKDLAFRDMDPNRWSHEAVLLAASQGWIWGYPDGTFRPNQAISRAEVTAITNRMLKRQGDGAWIRSHREEVSYYRDVQEEAWYFETVMEASLGHDFIRKKDGQAETWTGLNHKTFID
ncbi:MAG: S-layer homology domain-containing protein [Tissierellia bacterium]|nr:S-layer homology domain-containing protein [Tissierellia bacterium]